MRDMFKGLGDFLIGLVRLGLICGSVVLVARGLDWVFERTLPLKAMGIPPLVLSIPVLCGIVLIALRIEEKRNRNRPVKREGSLMTESERQEWNANLNRGWLCLLTGFAAWMLTLDWDDMRARVVLGVIVAIAAWPVTVIRKIKTRPGLYALALLSIWLIYLGVCCAWGGMTHVGPGEVKFGGESSELYGDNPDAEEHWDTVSQSEYRRHTLEEGVMLILFGAVAIETLIALWRENDREEAQAFAGFAAKQQAKGNTTSKNTMKTKILISALGVFLLTCLFPPWLNVLDVPYHAHQRKPAGYKFILLPPDSKGDPWSVEIDLKTLFVEWAALAAIAGAVWLVVVKPPWSRDDEANHPQKFIPPPGNSQN